MKLFDILDSTYAPVNEAILDEIAVLSSWITNMSVRDNNIIITLRSGRQYRVYGAGRLFKEWNRAPSKGKFWHARIKGKFMVRRVSKW